MVNIGQYGYVTAFMRDPASKEGLAELWWPDYRVTGIERELIFGKYQEFRPSCLSNLSI